MKYFHKIGQALRAFPHIYFFTSTALLMLFCIFVWIDMPQGLFAGTDGRLYKNLISTQIQFSEWFSLNAFNPLQGMGNQIIPMNVWLHPAYLPFHFFSDGTAALISTALSWLALVTSCYFLSRKLGIGEATSIVAAQISTVLFFPFQYEFDQHINYLLNPGVALITALVITGLTLIDRLADDFSKGRLGVINLSLLFAIAAFGILADPIWFVVNCIFFLPFLAEKIFSSSTRTRWLVLGSLALLVVIFYFLGVIQYILTLFSYTARTFAPGEVFGHSPSAGNVSSMFLTKSRPLYLFLSIGLIFSIAFGGRKLRILAYCALGYFVMLLTLGAVYVVANTWTLPIPAYAEFAVMPVWLIISCAGIFIVIDRSLKQASFLIEGIGGRVVVLSQYIKSHQLPCKIGARLRSAAQLVVIFAVPLTVFYYCAMVMPDRHGIYIEEVEKVNPPGELLASLDKYAIGNGKQFNGYVANLNSQGVIKRTIHDGDIMNALWQRNIPTINEYSQLITPFSHFFFTRLAAGNNFGGINGTPIFEPNKTVLELLGVSAIVSNSPRELPGYKLTDSYRSAAGCWDLYLYERSRHFSLLNPTVWEYKGSLKEIYDEIRSPNFNPHKRVLVQEPLESKLVTARTSKLEIIRGGYRVSAEADDSRSSLLILPIQYSNCITVKNNSPHRPVRLFRANGLQTGVIFQGAVTFDLMYSLAINSSECKRRDIEDLRFAVKGLPPRPVTIRQPDAQTQFNLIEASATIKKFWHTTPIAEWLAQKQTSFSSIPEYKFSANTPACQAYADNTDRYTGNPYLENYGPPAFSNTKNDMSWLQAPAGQRKTLNMSEPFLGFGWGPIGQLAQGSVRRIAFGHNEGLILLRVEKAARYKLRLFYSRHIPIHVASALTVSFNGVKADVISSGQDGELAWSEFVLGERATKSCNGWVEIMVSTRGNTSRPPDKHGTEWTGFHFLLKNISVVRESTQRAI